MTRTTAIEPAVMIQPHGGEAVGSDLAQLVRLNAKYELDMDFESIPALCMRFGLTFPPS